MDLNYKTKANVVRYVSNQIIIKNFEGIDDVLTELFSGFDHIVKEPIKGVFRNISEYGLKYIDKLDIYGSNVNNTEIYDILMSTDETSRKGKKINTLIEKGLTINNYLEEVNFIEYVYSLFDNKSTQSMCFYLTKLEEEFFVKTYAKMLF